MRVFVLGGYGLIGSSVVARLSKAGCQIVGLTRSPRISSRFPNVEWHEGDISQLTSTDDWQPLISGCDAVVNCAGALQDSGTDSLAAVHVTGPLALSRNDTPCCLAPARPTRNGWNNTLNRPCKN